MKPLSLTLSGFYIWLNSHKVNINRDLLDDIKNSCITTGTFEHEFVINEVPWHGELDITVVFVNSETIQNLGWNLEYKKHEIELAQGVIIFCASFKTMYFTSQNIPKTSQRVRTLIKSPRFEYQINFPTSMDLDDTWEKIACDIKEIYSEFELIKLKYFK